MKRNSYSPELKAEVVLEALQREFPNFHVVNTIGTIDNNAIGVEPQKLWLNEAHLNTTGYQVFENRIWHEPVNGIQALLARMPGRIAPDVAKRSEYSQDPEQNPSQSTIEK